jgi:hypothetical protein
MAGARRGPWNKEISMMELANWAESAGIGAALAAVALLVWWVLRRLLPVKIAGIEFCERDRRDIESFRAKIRRALQQVDQKGRVVWRQPAYLEKRVNEFVWAEETLRILAEECPDCPLLRQIVGYRPFAMLMAGARQGNLIVVRLAVSILEASVGIAESDIRNAHHSAAGKDQAEIRTFLRERWEALTGKKWEDDPAWPPPPQEGYGSPGSAPGHRGAPEPTR